MFRVALYGLYNGVDKTTNVFTFQGEDEPSPVEVEAWLDNLYTPSFLSATPNVWSTTNFVIEKPAGVVINGRARWQFVNDAPYVRAGASSSQAIPQQSAAVVIGITASRRRGKKFIPAISEGNQSNGVLDPGLMTLLNAYGAAYISDMTLLVGTAQSGVCNVLAQNFLPFINFRVDTIMGTQKRRKQGRGQ